MYNFCLFNLRILSILLLSFSTLCQVSELGLELECQVSELGMEEGYICTLLICFYPHITQNLGFLYADKYHFFPNFSFSQSYIFVAVTCFTSFIFSFHIIHLSVLLLCMHFNDLMVINVYVPHVRILVQLFRFIV